MASDSLRAKLAQRLLDNSLPDALTEINDSLRYTIGLSEEQYARGAQNAVGLLLDQGFQPVHEYRSWRDRPGYRGFNSTWADPVSGHLLEFQFHTDASFVAKTISHSDYNDLRKVPKADRNTSEYFAKKAAHDAYFVDVRIPPGAADVRIPPGIDWHDPTGDLPAVPAARSADGFGLPTMDDGPRFATDGEALEVARRNVFDTTAGLGFYLDGDEVRDFARAVHPTDGYVTIDVHGSTRYFQIGDLRLTPDQFADALKQLRADGLLDLPAGVGIKLLSCDTGVGGLNSPAAVLARRLGVEVVAPDQPVWTALDGDEVVSSPTVFGGNFVPSSPPDGTWHRFIPVPSPSAPPGSSTSSRESDGSPSHQRESDQTGGGG